MDYRFNHIHLLCRNLQNSIDFFTQVLGASLITHKKFGDADGALLELNQVGINLRVHAKNEKINEDTSIPSYGYHHICVQVDDINAAYQDLTAKKVEFITPPRQTPDNDHIAFFKGPDGIIFELLQLS
ncbi:MAG: VOC family protein [Desulfobacteraceae bacterium]|jgi:catechol 2,3-dioxygenase-like lactoylglutathione lyase family enzyme